MTSNDARQVFAESGLTYDDMYDNLRVLKLEIQCAIEQAHVLSGSLSMKVVEGARKMDRGTRSVGCFFIRVDGPYFKDRECVSFNADGFVGFAGWASDLNAAPILQGFMQAVSLIKARKEGVGHGYCV